MFDNQPYHIPVMLLECLEGMLIEPQGCYVDVTFGGGGHSSAILSRLTEGGRLYSFDQDLDAMVNISTNSQFTFIAANFRHLARFMDYYGEIGRVDAVLADLGVSSHHFDTAERGFSFRASEPLLDMRMNTRGGLSAKDIINQYEESRLADILYNYGELKQSRQIAHRIVQARDCKSIDTIGDLLEIVRPVVSPKEEKKQLSCIFQALRIEVNDELGALQEMLEACHRVLKPGGRLVVMTYHSLEDRIVKNFVKRSAVEYSEAEAHIYGQGKSAWQLISRKPIIASAEEIMSNPRARSAKLRIASLNE